VKRVIFVLIFLLTAVPFIRAAEELTDEELEIIKMMDVLEDYDMINEGNMEILTDLDDIGVQNDQQ
jgi:hypothetical protein